MKHKLGKGQDVSDPFDYDIAPLLETREGLVIRTASTRWLVGLNTNINWGLFDLVPREIVQPIKVYICHILQVGASRSAGVAFGRLLAGFSRMSPGLLRSAVAGDLGIEIFHAFKRGLENDANLSSDSCKDSLHVFRRWYVWCADLELPKFLESVALELEQRIIGGSAKGQAVLSSDPQEGPISFVEDVQIETAITRDFGVIDQLELKDLQSLVAVLLSKSFGLYSAHLQQINEPDFRSEVILDGRRLHWLNIPRLKKRGLRAEVGARSRRISERVAVSISLLKSRNAANCERGSHISEMEGEPPLFAKDNPRHQFLGTALEGDAYRWRLSDFVNAMGRFAERHGLGFRITPRRLRYTFATRLVDEGCSPLELADALDHTDLQHVMIYFNSRGSVVRQLDAAMAIRLAPLANAFLGHIIPRRQDASEGDSVSTVIKFRGSHSELRDVGLCTISACGLDAPIACYTCPRFEPWEDGPHGFVLEELLKGRERKERLGMDGRIVQIHDRTILAVADVVRRTSAADDESSG